jgi:hypothetical protein
VCHAEIAHLHGGRRASAGRAARIRGRVTVDVRVALGAHERRVARRLEGRGLPGLGDVLAKLHGREIAGRWRLAELYAVGAEGAVFTATDFRGRQARRDVVKIPLLPYHRPAELSSSLLRHRRASLREEAKNLMKSRSPFMPAAHGVHDFVNPLVDKNRGGAFEEPDPALVMERLPGLDVDLWLARVHRSGIAAAKLRPHLDEIALALLHALRDLNQRGFYYADLRPGNLRVIGRPLRSVRLLDAGSLVEVDDAGGRFPHVPHYLPPDQFEKRYMRGEAISPSPAVQAVMAGRTLYEIVTAIVPVPGRPIDGAALKSPAVSPLLADIVDGLATGSFSSVLGAIKYFGRRAPPAPVVVAPRPAPLELEPAARPAAALPRVVAPTMATAPRPAAHVARPAAAPTPARIAASTAEPASFELEPPPKLVAAPIVVRPSATKPVAPPPPPPPPPWWRRLLDRIARRGESSTRT